VTKKSDIPFAGNFSPREVDLAEVIGFAGKAGGDRPALELAIRKRYYERPTTKPPQRLKLAYNVALGMQKYGLIEKDATLTSLGSELLELSGTPVDMYRRFAGHILVEMPGTLLLDTVRDMRAAGEPTSLNDIRKALLDRGMHTSTANKSISLMRLWLDEAKVTTKTWGIDEIVYREVLGLSDPELEVLVGLTNEERAILKVLAEIGTSVDSSKLRVAVEKAHAIRLNEKSFAKTLKPLVELGFIDFKPAGGKSAPVNPEPLLLKEVTIPLIEQYGAGLPAKLRILLRRPLAEIVESLDSSSGHDKGLALEALGFKMMRSIGLEYRETRFRPKKGRFEVDLLFDSERLGYSRWQVQCKNTTRVGIEDVAKEVGLVYRLLSDVIVIITRGRIGEEARRYAADVMGKTSLAIVLIDRDDVDRIVDDPLSIYDVLTREAAFASSLKRLGAS
jgi:site-specific DNA-methyltransferase (cytosine-N4-specific)